MKPTSLLCLLSCAQAAYSCLLEVEKHGGHWQKHRSTLRGRQTETPTNKTTPPLPVAKGDRFEGGKLIPQGLGIQGPNATINSIFNFDEVHSGLAGLVREFGLDLIEIPIKTYENRTIVGAKVGGKNGKVKAMIEANIHARERGGPDHVLYFISDLLVARREGRGLTYRGMRYTHDQVLAVLDVGIVFFPTVNPDGLAFDLATDLCWRKNRNPASANDTSPKSRSIGVDLNRNFDHLWDFPRRFAPGTEPASTAPDAEDFHGTSAFSESESRGIKWAMDQLPDLAWFVDIHSFSGMILYPWGDDSNQIVDPSQSFANTSWDHSRGILPDTPEAAYKTYISPSDRQVYSIVASNMMNSMIDSAGTLYLATQSVHLYPTSGNVPDYAYARHLNDKHKSKVYGFTIEFGQANEDIDCPFYPTASRHNSNVVEVGSGLMEFLLAAARYS